MSLNNYIIMFGYRLSQKTICSEFRVTIGSFPKSLHYTNSNQTCITVDSTMSAKLIG